MTTAKSNDAPAKRGATINVLLVDDSPSIRENTADWFRCKGYTVVAVPCAFAARDMVRNGYHVEAMIIDLQLPCGQEGVIIDWLNKGGTGEIPVVVWTAEREVEEKVPGFRVVYKPCENEELEAALLEVVAEKQCPSGKSKVTGR